MSVDRLQWLVVKCERPNDQSCIKYSTSKYQYQYQYQYQY